MAAILIVDDKPDTLTVTSTLLCLEGHRVLTAMEAHEAVSIALSEQPQVIVIESLEATSTSTIDLCLRLKGFPQTRDIPIVLLGETEIARVGRAQECYESIETPRDFDGLLECITGLLAATGQATRSGHEDDTIPRIRYA